VTSSFTVSELLYLLFLLFCLTYMRRETLIPANARRRDLPGKRSMRRGDVSFGQPASMPPLAWFHTTSARG
jgi:hypothetical protein